MPTGVNLNRYSGSGSCIPWAQRQRILVRATTVSMSLGHSVVFQVRRVPGDMPSSMTLDHGDLLVMDGSAQSEYAHRTVPGLPGPRFSLTASCPLAGAAGCVLPTRAQGSVEPGSRWLGEGQNKLSSSWGLFLLLLILVLALLVSTWIYIRRGRRHSCQRLSRSAAYFPSRGRARWVGGRRWRMSRRRQSSKRCLFISLLYLFWDKTLLFFSEYGFLFLYTAGYASS